MALPGADCRRFDRRTSHAATALVVLLAVRDSSSPRNSLPPGILDHGVGTRARHEPHGRLAVRPALSPARAHLAVLGRQYGSRPLHRRPRSADHAGVHPLERRVCRSCCRSPPAICARLAADPQARGRDDAARVHRLLRLQHAGLLRPAIHHGDQRPAAAVGRAAVRGDVDLRAVRRPADAAPSRRHLRLAHRRPRHRLPRQPRRAAGHRVQSRRRLFPDRAGDLWLLCGLPAQAACHASVLVPRRRNGRGRA